MAQTEINTTELTACKLGSYLAAEGWSFESWGCFPGTFHVRATDGVRTVQWASNNGLADAEEATLCAIENLVREV